MRISVKEAYGILDRALDVLARSVKDRGHPGAEVRRAIGDLRVKGMRYISDGVLGQPLADCFNLARIGGGSLATIKAVRLQVLSEAPRSLTAVSVTQSLVNLTLVQQSLILADMSFDSRDQVDEIFKDMNAAFDEAILTAADQYDSDACQKLVALHAAVSRLLTKIARPLPRMVSFTLQEERLPSLCASNFLYGDGSRAEELIKENGVVHPLFMIASGRALSNA